jgi:hypothetical protein
MKQLLSRAWHGYLAVMGRVNWGLSTALGKQGRLVARRPVAVLIAVAILVGGCCAGWARIHTQSDSDKLWCGSAVTHCPHEVQIAHTSRSCGLHHSKKFQDCCDLWESSQAIRTSAVRAETPRSGTSHVHVASASACLHCFARCRRVHNDPNASRLHDEALASMMRCVAVEASGSVQVQLHVRACTDSAHLPARRQLSASSTQPFATDRHCVRIQHRCSTATMLCMCMPPCKCHQLPASEHRQSPQPSPHTTHPIADRPHGTCTSYDLRADLIHGRVSCGAGCRKTARRCGTVPMCSKTMAPRKTVPRCGTDLLLIATYQLARCPRRTAAQQDAQMGALLPWPVNVSLVWLLASECMRRNSCDADIRLSQVGRGRRQRRDAPGDVGAVPGA